MKKYYLFLDTFRNRMIIGTLAIAMLSIFNLWFSYKDQSPVKSAINQSDKLSVVEIKRLTHPDYSAGNSFYGVLNPFNLDETRLVFYELQQDTESVADGRGYVWGYIGTTECAQSSPCLLDWDNSSEYSQAAKVVPTVDSDSAHRWKPSNVFWSTLEGEEAVLYSIPYSGIYKVYRIDLTDSSVTEVASFDPANGTDLTATMCYGITDRNTLRCSFKDEDWSAGGFEVNITTGEIAWINSSSFMATANPAVTYCQANPGATLPAQYYGFPHYGHGHSAKSVSGLYHAMEYGAGQGIWRLSDCTYIDDQNYEAVYPHDLFWLYPTHVTWNNSQDNYFFGSTANSFYDSSQREGHNTEPWLRSVSLLQILFDENTAEVEYNHLTTFLTAGKWNAEAPEQCASDDDQCSYQWKASPLSFVNRDGRKILFTSTMGSYSYKDHELTGITPYDTNGLFMATLALNSEINECIDADKDGFGANCVFGADCNDSNHFINPNVPEVYDGVDNDCDAQIDCADDPNLVCSPKSLYVDVSSLGGACSDSRTRANNSLSAPFCSIEKATELVEPGDTVYIRQGSYEESDGLFVRRGGGSENHRVVFRPYQSEYVDVVLGRQFSSWTDLGDSIYSKSFASSGFDLTSLKAIEEDSYAILQAPTMSDLQNIAYAAGENLFYVNTNTNTVYVRALDLVVDDIFFVDAQSMINIQAPFITWQNLNISYGYRGFDVDWYGIWDYYGSHGKNFYLTNSSIRHTYYEGVNSRADYLHLDDNFIDYNGTPLAWDTDNLTLGTNYDSTSILAIGKDALIENNMTKYSVTGLSYRSNAGTDFAAYRVQDFVIRNNDFYGRVVGSGYNNLFYNNIIQYPPNVGFSIFYDNKYNKIYNNLIYSDIGVLLNRYIPSRPGQYTDFRNNIVIGTSASSRCVDFEMGDVDTFTMDYNLYYNCSNFYRYDDPAVRIATNFNNYKTYMADFSQEQHSFSINPSLASAEADLPFYPDAQSLVIDAGTSLSGTFTYDKRELDRPYNNIWDIGPYEYGAFTVVAPTCSDGVENGNETGVDCGGSCSACSYGGGGGGGQGGTPPPPPVEEEPEVVCGNSIEEEGETCDDGNLTNNDGCSYLCQIEEDVETPNTNQIEIPKLQGTLIKTQLDPRVYYINNNNERYYIPNFNTFASWFQNFNSLSVVTPQTLASYPYLGRLTVKPGNLVKFDNDNKVYAVEPTKTLRWISTGNIFQDFGYDFNKIIHLPSEDFQHYTLGSDITNSNTHPTGQLLKHGNFTPIFYIKDSIEYWIKDEATFLSLGFKWQDIITIPVRYWYTRVLDGLQFRLQDR